VQVGGVIDIQVGVGAPPAGPVGWGLQSPRQENAVWSGGFAKTSLRYKPEAKQKAKGFFYLSYYNSSNSDKCHYNSVILKLAITILGITGAYHFLRT
jgi:hypothetical protein